jgi:hypothetical protein
MARTPEIILTERPAVIPRTFGVSRLRDGWPRSPAFALECLLGAGPEGFPMGPAARQQAARQYDGPLGVPDELFEIVFPD